MEADGVVEMYQRSVQRYNIRYNSFIGDGDSSAYSTVDREGPYRPTVFIKKEGCVNHVTKRMGTNLHRLIKEYKGKKLGDGKVLSGKGRLKISRIDAIQSFYGHAIHNNKGNLKKMSKEMWAILHHYSSTIEKPTHSNCPMGSLSWCSYQRDTANDTNSYKPAKYTITDSMAKVLTPIFKRLADEAFLEVYKNVSNQNASKSFNNLLWSFYPKEQFNCSINDITCY